MTAREYALKLEIQAVAEELQGLTNRLLIQESAEIPLDADIEWTKNRIKLKRAKKNLLEDELICHGLPEDLRKLLVSNPEAICT